MFRKWLIFILALVPLAYGIDDTFFCQFGPAGRPADGKMSDSLYIFVSLPAEFTAPVYIRVFDADCGGKWDEQYGKWNVRTDYRVYTGEKSVLAYDNRKTEGTLLGKELISISPKHDNQWQTIFTVSSDRLKELNGRKWFKVRIKTLDGNDGNIFLFNVSKSPKNNEPVGTWYTYRPVIRLSSARKIVSYLSFKIPESASAVTITNFDADYDRIRLVTPERSDVKIKSSGNSVYAETAVKLLPEEKGRSASLIAGIFSSAKNNNEGFFITADSGEKIPFILPFYQGERHIRPTAKFSYHATENKNEILFDASKSKLQRRENAEYYWDFGDGGSGRGMQTVHAYSNPGTYKVTLKVADQSNFVDNEGRVTRNVFINAEPVAKLSFPAVAALGKKVKFDASQSYDSDGKITKYIWEVMGERKETVKPVFYYSFNIPGKYRVKLTVRDNSDYPNRYNSVAGDIIVNSAPLASFSAPDRGAVGEKISFDAANSLDSDGEINGYRWDFGDGAAAEGSLVSHAYAEAGKYKVSLTVIDNSGVENNSAVMVKRIFINAPPVARAGSDRVAAAGDRLKFSAAKSYDPDGKIISYEWDFGDGGKASGKNVFHTFQNPGDYRVELKVTDNSETISQTASVSVGVHINFPPVPVIKAPALITINPVEFDASQSRDPDGKITRFKWNFGDGSYASGEKAEHTYRNPGSYVVKLGITDDSGTKSGKAEVTHSIIINALPEAHAGKNILVAPGEEFVLDGSESLDPDGKISSFQWFFEDRVVSSGSGLKYSLTEGGVYPFLLKVTDNSGDPSAVDYDEVKVRVNTRPAVSFSAPERLDPGKKYTFSAENCYDPDGDKLSYTWIFKDKKYKGKKVSLRFREEGIFSLTLLADDGTAAANSQNSVKKTIWVNSRPIAIAGKDILTNQREITLDGSGSSDPDDDPLTYKWSMGDGTVLTGIKVHHRYSEGGVFPVRLTVSDGLGFSNSENYDDLVVRINRAPTADAGENISTCAGLTVLFNGSGSSDPDNDLLKYEWDFGDGSTSGEMSPVHRYEKNGKYRVRLKVTDNSGLKGNESEDNILVTVIDSPVASFTADKKITCINKPVKFDASSSTDVDGVVNAYLWDFGDGKSGSGKQIIHSFDKAGKYSVRLKILGNEQQTCKNFDYYEMEIQVNKGPEAKFVSEEKTCQGKTVVFDASASRGYSGEIKSYEWNFGDGTTATGGKVEHVFSRSGVFPVKLTVKTDSTLSCFRSELVKSIIVNDRPTAAISAPDTVALNGDAVFSVLDIKDNVGGVASFLWTFSDGYTAGRSSVRRKFVKSGKVAYTVSLKDNLALPCSENEISGSIYINYPPEVSFNLQGKTFAVGDTIYLDASGTSDRENNKLEYLWNISDGTSLSGGKNAFVPEAPGGYQINLIVSDGYNSAESGKAIYVKEVPRVEISVKPSGCPVNKYRLSAMSSSGGELDYLWQMPDGKTSRNRVLDYLIPRGTQTAEIKLTVSGERFLKVEKEIELKAEPMAAAEFTFSGVLYAGAATDYVLFDASRSNSPEDKPLTYKWSFGDGSAGSGKMVRHHYKKPGKYRVRLTINDSSRRCRAVSIEKIIEIKKRVR